MSVQMSSLLDSRLNNMNNDHSSNTIINDCVIWHIQNNQPEFKPEPTFFNPQHQYYCEFENHNRILSDVGHTKGDVYVVS